MAHSAVRQWRSHDGDLSSLNLFGSRDHLFDTRDGPSGEISGILSPGGYLLSIRSRRRNTITRTPLVGGPRMGRWERLPR